MVVDLRRCISFRSFLVPQETQVGNNVNGYGCMWANLENHETQHELYHQFLGLLQSKLFVFLSIT